MHVATGEAVAPRKWEEAGWPPPAPHLPSLEIILDQPVDTFLENVLSQHYIIAYGNHRDVLNDLCHILGVEMVSSQTANGVSGNGQERREKYLSGNHGKHQEVVFFDPASIKHL
jgi:PBP1b-binding outer membrane lipoprotein LpoB